MDGMDGIPHMPLKTAIKTFRAIDEDQLGTVITPDNLVELMLKSADTWIAASVYAAVVIKNSITSYPSTGQDFVECISYFICITYGASIMLVPHFSTNI
ncbi:hypothetical protein KM043_000124 [Ampulex compressa]|nr:hypothetical protein KM043_000124 [Ampulex compressa]